MSDIDVAALRAAAEGATPGPWELVGDSTWSTLLMSPDNATIHGDDCGCGGGIVDQDDIAYIAAANPAVVLDLLDRLAAAEGAVARVRSVRALIQMWADEAEKRGPADQINTAGVVAMLAHAIKEQP